jgi:hypothetical protein
VVDYIVRAIQEFGRPASNEELAAKIVEYGWHTKSDDKPVIVAATLRKYPEFHKVGGRWTFSPLYYENRPGEPVLPDE